MLSNERVRLLREDPWDATDLSQELYAMFSDENDPVQFPEGIKLPVSDKVPPLQLEDFSPDDTPILSVKRTEGSYTLTLVAQGNLILNFQGQTGPEQSNDLSAGGKAKVTASANSFPGKLIAYLGSNIYTVTIYPDGLGANGQNVTVTQLEGDPASPHNTDGTRWAIVVKTSDGSYYMWVPVWG